MDVGSTLIYCIEKLGMVFVDNAIAKVPMASDVTALFAIVISVFSLIVSIIAITVKRRRRIYEYLAKLWNDLLDTCAQNEHFININFTDHYWEKMTESEMLKYEAFCYKAWGLVEDIVEHNYQGNRQLRPLLYWICALHFSWLERNPTFFPLPKFWKTVSAAANEPQALLRYRPLPEINGAIDWDTVSKDYHRYILGPFAPEMLQPDKLGNMPNLLVHRLREKYKKEGLSELNIADFGCGPGNLLLAMHNDLKKIHGVDISPIALRIASSCAKKLGITFIPHEGDIASITLDEKFDIIISCNSVLPQNRDKVIKILENIKNHLRPNGMLYAIMPSFDTIVYLRNLWRQHYSKLYKSDKHADRVIASYDIVKLFNKKNHSFADDGKHPQCYHTRETLEQELTNAGLKMICEPAKIEYPWELTRRFDYGFFPDAEYKIWDWFVIAEKA